VWWPFTVFFYVGPVILAALAVIVPGWPRFLLAPCGVLLGIATFVLGPYGIGFHVAPVTATLVGAFAAFRWASTALRPGWPAFALGLCVPLAYWLLVSNNWQRLGAAAEIAYLCRFEAHPQVARTVQGAEGLRTLRSPNEKWATARGLRFVEWQDPSGRRRMDRGDRSWYPRPVDSFQAPYEMRERRGLLPFDVIIEETTVHARGGGEPLGVQRGFRYGTPEEVDSTAPPKYRAPLWGGIYIIDPTHCSDQVDIAPTNVVGLTINPSDSPPSYVRLAPKDSVIPILDENPMPTRSKPPYVGVAVGREVHRMLDFQNLPRVRAILAPHLREKGWCASFAYLPRSLEESADGGLEFILRCE
jgi:hypothetical protein